MNKLYEKGESNMEQENRKWFKKLGFSYFISTIVIMVLQTVGIIIFQVIAPDFAERYYMLVSMLPLYIIGTPILLKIIGRQPAAKIEKGDFPIRKVIAAFFVGIAAMQLGNLIGIILNVGLANLADTEAKNPTAEFITTSTLLQNFIVVVIGAPIFEELVFRKWLMERTVKYGEGTAILISGFAFGLFHGNIIQFAYATLVGMVLAYVYVKSGRVIYTIVLHMITNFFGGIVSVWVANKSNIAEITAALTQEHADAEAIVSANSSGILLYTAYLIIIIVFILAGVIIFFCNVKKLNILPGEVQIAKGKRFKTIVSNIGTILYIAVWCAMMVVSLLG